MILTFTAEGFSPVKGIKNRGVFGASVESPKVEEFTFECLVKRPITPFDLVLIKIPEPDRTRMNYFDRLISPTILSWINGENELQIRRIWDHLRRAVLADRPVDKFDN